MSNDNVYERLFKQQAMIGKLILDGNRDLEAVSRILQSIITEREETLQKFTLLADLGVITIPEDTSLDSFLQKNRKKFYDVDKNITDANFPNPSRILKPGDKIGVRAYKQIVSVTTTTEERMKFLRQQPGNIFVGAHGIPPVFEQVKVKLPKGFWYASFDEEDRLPYLGSYHRVPVLHAYSRGVWHWHLGYFERVWHDTNAFFGFRDLSQTLDA